MSFLAFYWTFWEFGASRRNDPNDAAPRRKAVAQDSKYSAQLQSHCIFFVVGLSFLCAVFHRFESNHGVFCTLVHTKTTSFRDQSSEVQGGLDPFSNEPPPSRVNIFHASCGWNELPADVKRFETLLFCKKRVSERKETGVVSLAVFRKGTMPRFLFWYWRWNLACPSVPIQDCFLLKTTKWSFILFYFLMKHFMGLHVYTQDHFRRIYNKCNKLYTKTPRKEKNS